MDPSLRMEVDYSQSTEAKPLLPTNANVKPHERNGAVGPSIFNLLNSAIGAGILAIPLAFFYSGIALGTVLVLSLAFVSQYTLLVISQTAELYPDAHSYEQLVSQIFGRSIGKVIKACIITSCFGTCSGFLIIIGELITGIFKSIAPEAAILQRPAFVILIVSIFILPLASFKTFNSMRFSSIFAVCSILFVVSVVVSRSVQHIQEVGSHAAASAVNAANWSPTVFSAIPLICFALSCHLQLVPIHAELKDYQDMKKVKIMVGGAEAICFVLYTLTGIFGYILFNDRCTISDNVLSDFPNNDVLATVARGVLALIIICHYPSAGFVLRKAVHGIVFPNVDDNLPRRVGLALVCWGCCFLLASWLPYISLVFGVLGSTVSSMIAFFFPSLFLYKHFHHPKWRGMKGKSAKIISFSICLLSLFMFFAGTITTILNHINAEKCE